MDPPYQRRSVWNDAYRESFIDTILIQYPAPAIFLYEEISPEGHAKYNVVDGKQRLTAIFDFVENRFPVSEQSPAVDYRGKYFAQLDTDGKTRFWTYEFSVEYLPTNQLDIVNNIFERINKNTAKLTRQELRHARFDGVFITCAEELTEWMLSELPPQFPRFAKQSQKQMKDVELVANLLLLLEEGPRGHSQDELDEVFGARDLVWEARVRIEDEFRRTLSYIKHLSGLPADRALFKTRLVNHPDFYSLVGAVVAADRDSSLPTPAEAAQRIADFLTKVEDPLARAEDIRAEAYYQAARSATNDTGPRKERTNIMKQIITGQ